MSALLHWRRCGFVSFAMVPLSLSCFAAIAAANSNCGYASFVSTFSFRTAPDRNACGWCEAAGIVFMCQCLPKTPNPRGAAHAAPCTPLSSVSFVIIILEYVHTIGCRGRADSRDPSDRTVYSGT